jgi:predicted enzyme related to lactoylglutathione lyase
MSEPAEGTPTTLGLRTVIYHVPDLSRARDWYARAFGIVPYFDEPFYVGFQVGGFELGLDPDCSRVQPGEGGGAAYWGVADINAAHDAFVGAGATVLEPPHEVGGGIWVSMLADPFGNAIGLIQNPFFSTDAVL